MKLEKEVKKRIQKKKNKIEKDIVKCRKSNPKKFYRFINNSRATRSKIGPLKNESDEIIVDPKEQAVLLNQYFASVFTKNTSALPTMPRRENGNCHLDGFTITKEKVKQVINQLNDQAAMGPDEIPPSIIKNLEEDLVQPLTILFQASMEQSRIPDDWRTAIVSPIYKMKGKKSDPSNYRPVSLTCVIGKMMERIVKEQLMAYLETNRLITDAQHGFRNGRSPQTNLIEFLNRTTKWLDKGRSFDILYFDSAKAFDKVCHKRLVMKLEQMGVEGKAKEWLRDWLSGIKKMHILELENARLEVRKNFFTVRIVNDWNKIPEEVKNQKTVNGFKGAYDRWKKGKNSNENVLRARGVPAEILTAGTTS